MINKYRLGAKVTKKIIDTFSLTVEAESVDEARMKAAETLKSFPSESEFNGVTSCYIENRDQSDVEVLTVWEED